MTNRREGREGREREGERDRERGSRAKPGIQLVGYIRQTNCPSRHKGALGVLGGETL